MTVYAFPTLLALTLFCTLLPDGTRAADWPQFRGPGGAASSEDRGMPVTWSSDENIAWQVALPGYGASSPIVIGDRLFITCYSGYGLDADNPGDIKNLKRQLLCLKRETGETLWRQVVAAEGKETNYVDFLPQHGYATSTPSSDGERVYVFFGTSGVRAYDLEGQPLWHASVGEYAHNWGTGGSLVVDGDRLLVNAAVESDAFIALDKRSGKELWRAKRLISSWSTPIAIEAPEGRRELVVSIKSRLLGLDPETGERLWTCQTKQAYASPSPILHDGLVYAFGGKPNVLLAVRPGGRGDVTETHVAWPPRASARALPRPCFIKAISIPSMSAASSAASTPPAAKSPIANGSLPRAARFTPLPSSPTESCTRCRASTAQYVLATGPKFKQLAVNRFAHDASVFNATPAISRSQLLLRSNRALYCIGVKP